jgi:mannose-6-phosphate isomerase-like protein (cupin superfamily)
MRFLPFLLLIPMFGADPSGLVMYKAGDLRGFEKKLAPKINEHKVANENLDKMGKYRTLEVHREGDGEVEIHETEADLMVINSGEGTLLLGGTVLNPKKTAPNEIRAPSMKGGEMKPLAAGDVVYIPAKIPHQVMVPAGKQITYFVAKVE